MAVYYLTNVTTNQYVAMQFNAPNGTVLVGNSAEWIVERPEVGGTLATLQNYGSIFMSSTTTVLKNNTAYAADQSGAPLTVLTMLDNSSKPISSVPYVGVNVSAWTVEGSAQ